LLSGEACLATSSRVYTAVIAVESGEKKAAGARESDRPERRVSSARFFETRANRRTIVEREKSKTLLRRHTSNRATVSTINDTTRTKPSYDTYGFRLRTSHDSLHSKRAPTYTLPSPQCMGTCASASASNA
jgi:hypothetical protein